MTKTLGNGKTIRATDDQLSVMACLSWHTAQPAKDLSIDTGIEVAVVKRIIPHARDNGWPITGSSEKGYLMHLDVHRERGLLMRHMLDEWAERNLIGIGKGKP